MKEVNGRKLRFVCFGLGAVGIYIGGSLMINGHDGVFIEFPEVAEKIRQNGLRLHLKDRVENIPVVNIVSSLKDALSTGDFDFALLAVKSYDLVSVINAIKPFEGNFPPVVCIQNGVENEELLRSILGSQRVIPATLTSAIGRGIEGEIFLERLRGVGIASNHILVPELLQAMKAAGLNGLYCTNAEGMKWTKMLTNLVANASSAILNMPPAEIFSHPALFSMEVKQLRECLQVMRSLNIPVINIPGVNSILFSLAVNYLPVSLSQPILSNAVGKGRGSKMPSFHIDLNSGKGKSEVNYLNGAVVRFGERCGVATPVNMVLTHVLTALINGEVDQKIYDHKPDKLLDLINT